MSDTTYYFSRWFNGFMADYGEINFHLADAEVIAEEAWYFQQEIINKQQETIDKLKKELLELSGHTNY